MQINCRKLSEDSFQEEDEFDDMVKSKKTLKDKLGCPEEIIKKARKKKGDDGDGLKQTKLNFSKGNFLTQKKVV